MFAITKVAGEKSTSFRNRFVQEKQIPLGTNEYI